jgi:hypothetical protein
MLEGVRVTQLWRQFPSSKISVHNNMSDTARVARERHHTFRNSRSPA